MILSLLIVAFVGFATWRGYHRGLVREVVDLVGILAALLLAHLLWPAVGALLRVLVPDGVSGWPVALAGIVLFGLLLGGVAFLSHRIGQRTKAFPDTRRRLDVAGGTAFAGAWSVLLATGILLTSVTVPGARIGAGPSVCQAPLARYLVGHNNPLRAPGELVADLTRPILMFVSQQMGGSFTLADIATAHPTSEPAPSSPEKAPAVGGATEPAAPSDGTTEPTQTAPLGPGDPGFCHQVARAQQFAVEGADVYYEFPAVSAQSIAQAPDAEAAVLTFLNDARATEGLPPLAADAPLRDVGRAHARDMYLGGYFAHDSLACRQGTETPGCRDPFDRMRVAGISYLVAGENLALAPTADAAHKGLMDSPGHRANILNPEFTHVGIGIYDGPYGLMVTQEFRG